MTQIIATDKSSSKQNPCVGCGACCSFFRVSFHSLECASAGGTVPDDTVEQVTPHIVAMKGTTTSTDPRCVTLTGTIGTDAQCGAYLTRSSSCREFDASYQFGVHDAHCDKARNKHGLPALTSEDWIGVA